MVEGLVRVSRTPRVKLIVVREVVIVVVQALGVCAVLCCARRLHPSIDTIMLVRVGAFARRW